MDGEISEEYGEIASDYDDEAGPALAAPGAPQRRRLSKPNKGTRFLVVLLQALVMASALFLFFLFAGIAAVVLLHLFVAGRSRRRRRRRLGRAGAPGAAGGLSQEELRRLPSCRYSGKGQGESADCAVCLEGVRAGERWRVLPACGHGFHKACVDRWLVRAPACPLCRAGVRAG